MASTSETGYPVWVGNLGTLIKYVPSLGPKYNPAKAILKLSGLNTVHANAEAKMQALKTAEATYKRAVSARETAFIKAKKLAVNLVAALAASGASKETIEFVKPIQRKIQGNAKSASASSPAKSSADEPAGKKGISTVQQSYKNITDHLERLIQTIFADPGFAPNEPEFQQAGLSAMVADLRAKTGAVENAEGELSAARDARKIAVQGEPEGVCAVGSEAKKYVKAIFGSDSKQYKGISKLDFPRKKK
jgi:hypothetical protein